MPTSIEVKSENTKCYIKRYLTDSEDCIIRDVSCLEIKDSLNGGDSFTSGHQPMKEKK
jgi:hypothetical protein